MITLRPALPGEWASVGELTVQAYLADGAVRAEDPYLDVLRDAAARAAGAELWVASDDDGALLGTVTYCPQGSAYRELGGSEEGEFRALAVAPGARRRGVGALLVDLCLDRAVADGFASVVISTAEWMTTAHRMYARLGFVPAPERDWWPRPDVHLLALVRSASPTPPLVHRGHLSGPGVILDAYGTPGGRVPYSASCQAAKASTAVGRVA